MTKPRSLLLAMCACLLVAQAPFTYGWGEEGHRMINAVAASKLPADMPAFFTAAATRLEFLGPEPDRWRDTRELYTALREVNGPDHFIDIDDAQNFAVLPNDRYLYGEWLRAHGKDPKDMGFLPYSILEGFEKVEVLFRLWRDPQRATERAQIEQNIVYYAGVLGHYVADGSQPLHATFHYNGWSGSANPHQYTREQIHGRFEADYVKAKIKASDFSGQVNTASVLSDAFADEVSFLLESNRQVEPLYRMDQTARWDANNSSADSKKFVTARLAAGAQMLANLWYTAWINSAK